MPGYWGRMDHGWRARADCSRALPARALELLAPAVARHPGVRPGPARQPGATHGADKLCLGTDYPFDMSEPDPGRLPCALVGRGQDKDPRAERGRAARARGPRFERARHRSGVSRGRRLDPVPAVPRQTFNVGDRTLLGVVTEPVKPGARPVRHPDVARQRVPVRPFQPRRRPCYRALRRSRKPQADPGPRRGRVVVRTAATGLAHDFFTLSLARIGVGVGEATAFPAAMSLIPDLFRPTVARKGDRRVPVEHGRRRHRRTIVAGVMAASLGWRSMFDDLRCRRDRARRGAAGERKRAGKASGARHASAFAGAGTWPGLGAHPRASPASSRWRWIRRLGDDGRGSGRVGAGLPAALPTVSRWRKSGW